MIKLFDEYINTATMFSDENLDITKILHGPNIGKIGFSIHVKKDKTDLHVQKSVFGGKYSMFYGSILIIGTKYEKMSEIRRIETGRFRKISTNTMESIFTEFMKDMGYNDLSFTKERIIVEDLIRKFGEQIEKVATNSQNLGEIIDGLKSIRNQVFDYLKKDFEEWIFKRDVDKYNI